jgi:hypothetical protein
MAATGGIEHHINRWRSVVDQHHHVVGWPALGQPPPAGPFRGLVAFDRASPSEHSQHGLVANGDQH